MKDQTVKRWKRDALEVIYDHDAERDPTGKLIKQMANRIVELAHELESIRISSHKSFRPGREIT